MECARNPLFVVTKTDKQTFIASLTCSAFGYLYFAFNIIQNHDAIEFLYWDWTTKRTYTQGRWVEWLLYSISGGLLTPWLSILIAIIALALCTVLIIRIFDVKDIISIIAISACFSLNPFMISSFIYTFMIDDFMIGLLFGILGVYLVNCHKVWGLVAGSILVSISMARYQAFVCVIVAILTIRLLQVLVQGYTSNMNIIRLIIKYAIHVVGSMVLYLLINRLVLLLTNTNMSEYRNLDTMGQIGISQLIGGIRPAYHAFINYFEVTRILGGEIAYIAMIFILLFVLISSLGLLIYRKNKSLLQILLVVIILFSLPILLNTIFFTGAGNIHLLMQHSLCFLLVCGVVLCRELNIDGIKNLKPKFMQICTKMVVICAIFIAFRWGVIANETATVLEMQNRNMYALCIRIVDRIEQYPDFDIRTTPVAIIIGYMEDKNSNYPVTKPYFAKYQQLTGIFARDYAYIGHPKRTHDYIRDHIGFNYINKDYDLNAITTSEEYQEIPTFPAKESLAIIDGVLVVKVSTSNFFN